MAKIVSSGRIVSPSRRNKTAVDRGIFRTEALRSVLEKTDRIISPRDVRVRITGSQIPAPGFTDGQIITLNQSDPYINQSLIEGLTPEFMTVITGVNYHELAHHMFTPRLTSALAERCRTMNIFMGFNVLEDQSAESRFVRMFDPATQYFNAVVSKYLLDTPQQIEANYALVSGRLFVPGHIRDMLRARFFNQGAVDRVDEIVTEYKSLSHLKDTPRMVELIQELTDILNDNEQKITQDFVKIDNHGNLDQGDVDPQAMERSERMPEQENQGERNQAGEDDQGDEGKDEKDAEEGGGAGTTDPPKVMGKEIQEALERSFRETVEELAEELDQKIRNVKREEASYKVDRREDTSRHESTTADDHEIVKRCRDELRRLEVQTLPGWDPNRRTGKLNPRSYARALRGDEHVFRQWRQGIHNAIDFEVVFVQDTSGSMSSVKVPASRANWILARMFEHFKGVVTVLGFSGSMSLLSQRGKRTRPDQFPVFNASGGTNVTGALEEADRILSVSRAKQKLIVLVTDGEFGDLKKANDFLAHVCQFPIMLVGLGTKVEQYEKHHCVLSTAVIGAPMDLVALVRDTALEMVRRAM